jgi:hypothetical protein
MRLLTGILLMRLLAMTVALPMAMSMSSGGRHLRRAPGQIHIYPTRVLLGGILQSQLATDLFNPWLNLLDVVGGVVSLSHNPASHTISKLTLYP